MKRLAWSTVVVLTTFMSALLVWELRTVVMLLVSSLVIAATVRPSVDWFAVHRMPRKLALLVTYVACIGLVIILMLIISGPLLTDLQQLTMDMTSSYEQLKEQWPHGTSFQQTVVQWLPAASDLYAAITGPRGGTLLQTALGFTMSSFDLLGQLLISVVLSIYWSADQERFKRLWASLLPFETRARARGIWQHIELDLGGYLRSQVIQSVLASILLIIGYHVLGLKYPAALAVIGTIGWLIPWVGVLLAVIPAVLVALPMSLLLAVLTAAFTIGVLSFLEFVVEPRLFNRRRFSSLLAIIVVLVLAEQFGLLGILIGPPFAAMIQILASHLFRTARLPSTPQHDEQTINALQVRLQSIQALLETQTESSVPEITNLVNRLNRLIARATQD